MGCALNRLITAFAPLAVLLTLWSSMITAAENITVQPSKIANIVQQAITRCEDAAAQGINNLSVLGAPTGLAEGGLVRISPAGEIELLFHAAGPTGPQERADLEALGATIVDVLQVPPNLKIQPAGMIQAWIPYDKVEAAAALPWVVAVTPPGYGEPDPHPVNPINSEGVGLHNADLAQAQGITGNAVTVGVISTGAANVATAQGVNELPIVNVINTNSGDEGTAMLEIIHDMAPDATLIYDDGAGTAGTSVMRHFNALNNLVTNGANVIAEDLAFDSQPAFQQGLLASTAEAIAAGGVSVHSSAGNRATDHAARVQAVGTGGGPDGVNFGATPPGCTFTPDNVVAIAPGGDTTFDVTLGQTGSGATSITLQWSEPRAIFPTAGQGGFTDLNLYVMDAGLTRCLAESVGVQANGVGDTIEQISIDMPGTAAKIVVDVQGTSSAVAAPILDLRWRRMQAETDATTRAGSLNPDSNYIGLATSAAAVNATGGNIEGFSSGGPVQLGLTTVCPGGAAGPCAGVAGGGVSSSPGPTWAAADGVRVSGSGGFGSGTCPSVNPGDCRFFGTSASAPHAAGCDALLRSLPSFGAASPVGPVNARLIATAADVAPPGPDNVTGAGTLDCFAALGPPNAICQSQTVPTDPGVCSASSASIDNGSNDPFGQPITVSETPTPPYSLGATLVTLSVTDPDGLSDSCSATVTVEDQEAPTITAPADITQECTSPGGTPVTLGSPTGVLDNCDASPMVSNDAPALFPLGSTTVTWTATDDAGNMGHDAQVVTIVDTTPPELSVALSPSSLWPPNHKLVTIVATVTATDICDADPEVRLVSVTSNEPDNGLGDGDTPGDIVIVDDFTLELRAERSGLGDGRVYTVTYEAEDDSGNVTTKQATVTVAKSQGSH